MEIFLVQSVDNVNSYFLPNKVPAFDVMFGGQKIVPATHSSVDSPLYVAEKYYSDSMIKGNSCDFFDAIASY